MDVLCDMYANPRLAPADIVKERGVIVEEIMMYRDQPHHRVQEMLTAALWKNHPLGRPITGESETLRAMGRRVIAEYKERRYVAGNTVFALAGKVDHDACRAMVERHVGKMAPRGGGGWQRVDERVAQDRWSAEARDIEQTHLAIGFRLFGRHDPRRYALRLLNAVLGENMSSRLFQVVRERHGLAYSIQSSCQLFEDSGALVVGAGLDRERTVRAVELIAGEMSRLRENPIGPRELRRAKDYVIGQLKLGLESSSHQMTWAGDNLLSYGEFLPPEDIIAAISAVTAQEVLDLARTAMRPSAVSVAIVAPADVIRSDKQIVRLLTRT